MMLPSKTIWAATGGAPPTSAKPAVRDAATRPAAREFQDDMGFLRGTRSRWCGDCHFRPRSDEFVRPVFAPPTLARRVDLRACVGRQCRKGGAQVPSPGGSQPRPGSGGGVGSRTVEADVTPI